MELVKLSGSIVYDKTTMLLIKNFNIFVCFRMLLMQPKQIIEVFKTKNGREVTIRVPDIGDVEGLINFINELVDEGAPILTNERQTYSSEIRYLADEIQKILDGKLIALVAVADNKIVAHAEIRKWSGRASHVGTLGIAVLKEFRNLGIGKELIRLLIELARS